MVLISVKQSHYWPGQSPRTPAEFEAARFQDNQHINVSGCQPYAPAAFSSQEYSWYYFCWGPGVA
jgi:hypothetical protein